MSDIDEQPRVELWAASLPWPGRFAIHSWLLIIHQTETSCGGTSRWEVWHHANVGGIAWGHIHRDLFPPHAAIGGGPARMITTFQHATATILAARIEQSPHNYPHRDHYRVFPGPNSNTYVQWLLSDMRQLPRRAIGRSYRAEPKKDRDLLTNQTTR